jgi:hypothetical protein
MNAGHFYTNLAGPTDINLSWIVDSTNGNGLGVRSVKSNGYVQNVFMNTSPAATTSSSVFASGVTTITLSRNVSALVPGMVVTDSTTGANITNGTKILSINPQFSQITLSAPTAGASASSPGDTLSFAMTAALAGNPNPEAGYAVIQLKGNYNRYIGGFSGVQAPLTSTSTTSLTAGDPYVITSLGTTTTAQWQTAGLPMGFTPAVGSAFIAAASASLSGTGTVGVPAASPIVSIQVVGDPNQEISNSNSAANGGMQLIVSMQAATSSSTTTLVPTAPANNSVVGMTIRLDNSSVSVDGL